ncbi:MAG: Hsp70 family protein [Pseudohongiellaceae bacterium]
MNLIGFDFGTTNSLISLIRGDRAIHFLNDEGRPIPSIVCYEGSSKIVGQEAKERLSQSGLGIQGNIIRSPKRYLGKDGVFIEGVERRPIDIVADVVEHVVKVADSRNLDLQPIAGAVVTIPVGMEGYQRHALREAFRQAGLRIVQFVHEPFAALYGHFRSKGIAAMLRKYNQKLLLVCDWGGGTLDLTLCRPIDRAVVQLMNDGTDEVGGDIFDQQIMDSLIQKVIKSRNISEVIPQPGAEAKLMYRCENAKITLSKRSNVSVYVDSFFQGEDDGSFDYSLSQDELEQIVKPLLDKGFKRIEKLLEDAGYGPDQVALCIATGGMSNIPAVSQRLHERFGPERVCIPDNTATLIAEGAAWIASDQIRLELAKDVELILARNSYLPLVKAGTTMPTEGDVLENTRHLYCTDPRDGVAKFQICSPNVTNTSVRLNEPRTNLGGMTVKVDSRAEAFFERLELDVQIDHDLILKAHARSLNIKDEDRCEIHNLEFRLPFPTDISSGGSNSSYNPEHPREAESTPIGGLSVRTNLADRKDKSLVPGEFLYQYEPHYFDRRRDPPDIQVKEKLYYQECSLCGRASNDPACVCASSPNRMSDFTCKKYYF